MRIAVSSTLAFAAVVVAAVAFAQPAKSGANVIELHVANDQFTFMDLGASGPSIGDMYVFSDRLLQNGQPFGRDGGTCQVTGVSGATILTDCVLSIRTAEGQITAQGLWDHGTSPLDMAITGGTGPYERARGHLRATDIGTPNEAYRLEIIY